MILFQVLPVIIVQLWMDALILPLELSGVIQCAPDVTSCQPEDAASRQDRGDKHRGPPKGSTEQAG
jgi:hypothetical protein